MEDAELCLQLHMAGPAPAEQHGDEERSRAATRLPKVGLLSSAGRQCVSIPLTSTCLRTALVAVAEVAPQHASV